MKKHERARARLPKDKVKRKLTRDIRVCKQEVIFQAITGEPLENVEINMG